MLPALLPGPPHLQQCCCHLHTAALLGCCCQVLLQMRSALLSALRPAGLLQQLQTPASMQMAQHLLLKGLVQTLMQGACLPAQLLPLPLGPDLLLDCLGSCLILYELLCQPVALTGLYPQAC